MKIDEFKKFLKVEITYIHNQSFIPFRSRINETLCVHKIIDENGEGVAFTTTKSMITYFQMFMMYNLFHKKRKPYDYSNYHNCKAGKEFIESIKEIKDFHNVPHIEEESIWKEVEV